MFIIYLIKNSTTACTCKAGFYADTATTCSICLAYKCSDCDNTNKCYSCGVGYYLDNTTTNCCTIPNCGNCISNGNCTVCATNFFMNKNNICQNNSDIMNCANYINIGCGTCVAGFYLDSQNYCCSS
jgi:hypothetical protein